MPGPNDGTNGIGPAQPPRNSVAPIAETKNTLAYSARKKRANRMPLYSVWKPAANSDSASIRSNGVRLVSARPEMMKTMKPMKPHGVKTNHQFGMPPNLVGSSWAATIPDSDIVPASITGTSADSTPGIS